jgi:hypothetical protein
MAERVAGIGAWDADDEQALVSAISYDDPRVAGVPIPLERDRVTVVMAYVEFHEHDWLLSGFENALDGIKRALPRPRSTVSAGVEFHKHDWLLFWLRASQL